MCPNGGIAVPHVVHQDATVVDGRNQVSVSFGFTTSPTGGIVADGVFCQVYLLCVYNIRNEAVLGDKFGIRNMVFFPRGIVSSRTIFIVCNEDDKPHQASAQAAELSVNNGASWGLMLSDLNQYFPLEFKGAADSREVYTKLKQLTTK